MNIMTADEVVLRRHKPQNPHPHRGQSAYMALLSSLATDLDLMLNDLRSSSSPTTSRYIHHQPTTSSAIRSANQSLSIVSSQRLNHLQDFSNRPLNLLQTTQQQQQNHHNHQQQQQQYNHSQHFLQRQQHQIFQFRPLITSRGLLAATTSSTSSTSFSTSATTDTGTGTGTVAVSSGCSSTNRQTTVVSNSAATSERNFLWSETAASNTHQQIKSRRLPFCGVDTGGGGSDSIIVNSNSGTGNNQISGDNNDIATNNFNSIEVDGGCEGDGLIEDDLQALLPNCRQLSKDELSQSRASLISSSDGGVLAEGETSSETSEGSTSPPCDLGLVERLLRTHPVWFLPGIQRAGAVHLLQGKEEGNFIVRGSSQPNTMAVSVRLPQDTGPYIEHYLIQSNDGILSLESSRFKFDSIPALIAHYAQCCDELPVQLVLPRALREAKNRQQLSSLALLGQEFWRYPMANPKPINMIGSHVESKSPNSLTETSGIGTTLFSSTNSQQVQHQQQNQQQQPQQQQIGHRDHQLALQTKVFSPTNPLGGVFSQAGTPSDTTSSLSSFTTSTGQNHQLMSPESVDSVVLTMSPVEMTSNRQPTIGGKCMPNNLSTFKSTNQVPPRPPLSEKTVNSEQMVRTQRPTPPNTLNLAPLRTPPAPPVRWSKPLTPISPVAAPVTSSDSSHLPTNNFTVTTTVTFSVDNKNSHQFVEVTSPTTATTALAASNPTTTFQTFAKRPSPEGECKTNIDTLSSQGSSQRWNSQSSKDSNQSQRKTTSPNASEAPSNAKPRKSKSKKESKHYQESDILESPQVYCRSALGDKISDYEDIWSQETTVNNPADRGCPLSTFRPDGIQGKRPDLLPETPTITSLNCNILSPTNSVSSSSNPSPPISQKSQKLIEPVQPTNNNNDKQFMNNNNAKPLDILSPSDSVKNFLQCPVTDTNNIFLNVQPRNRQGLVLPLNSEDPSKSESDTTPTTQTPVTSRSKQGSPFYAEPADALRVAANGVNTSILRRSQRGLVLPPNHRHSEPPKPGIARNPICPILSPAELEKIAGSLDELKKKQQQKKPKGRLDQWPVDSSWEFMSKNENIDDDYGDYDSEEQWSGIRAKPVLPISQSKEMKEKPITVHQIIAKRLPDLNLPELVRCSTPQSVQAPIDIGVDRENSSNSNDGGHRISSYDNVERNGGHVSYTTSFLNGLIDSAQSDDGTVFSEPWDSSQWDSFLPQDDTSETIHISKCRAIISNSEDDTIIEEAIQKDNNNQGTLKATKSSSSDQQSSHQPQRVATILRTRSCRDREILCHPRNKTQIGGPGESVRAYTLQLANDHTSTFSRNIENFISCTKESREAAPQVVMRNMRQFMNGMKNYLVKHGEGDFHQEVQKARSRLKADEFLNLDAILEGVMHQLVVLPLREHLYGMFVDYYTRSGDIQLLVENVKYACGRSPSDFGIRATVAPPTSMQLNQISSLLVRLQEAELPLDKLDLFLCVIAAVFEATGCPRGQQLGADDFLPILVFVVAKCGFVGAEIEAEFMWGLLQPALLSGEAGYYLTALCSAVHVLKSFMSSDNEGTGSLDWRSSSLPACSSVLRVIIPDECNGSLQTRTLPVRPHTTTREVCRIIAHKARITNPQDYGLFKLVDGEETILADSECPQDARIAARGKHCMLAYKRIDAKIAWPTATIQQPSYG